MTNPTSPVVTFETLAKTIKKILKEEFPKAKFSVTRPSSDIIVMYTGSTHWPDPNRPSCVALREVISTIEDVVVDKFGNLIFKDCVGIHLKNKH